MLSPQSSWLFLPRDAQMLMEDVKRIVHELDQGQQLSSIGVELVDNELAILYMNSKKSEVNLLLFQLSLSLSLVCAVSSSICCAGLASYHPLPHVIHLDSDVLVSGSRQNILLRLPCRDQRQQMYKFNINVV